MRQHALAFNVCSAFAPAIACINPNKGIAATLPRSLLLCSKAWCLLLVCFGGPASCLAERQVCHILGLQRSAGRAFGCFVSLPGAAGP